MAVAAQVEHIEVTVRTLVLTLGKDAKRDSGYYGKFAFIIGELKDTLHGLYLWGDLDTQAHAQALNRVNNTLAAHGFLDLAGMGQERGYRTRNAQHGFTIRA